MISIDDDTGWRTFEDWSDVTDGYHTFGELYHYRALYNAAWLNELYDSLLDNRDHGYIHSHHLKAWDIHRSWKHSDGKDCFGGGWFIVMVDLPTGQVSNHYEAEYWDLFKIPEKKRASKWDGHTPEEAAERLHNYLTGNWS